MYAQIWGAHAVLKSEERRVCYRLLSFLVLGVGVTAGNSNHLVFVFINEPFAFKLRFVSDLW